MKVYVVRTKGKKILESHGWYPSMIEAIKVQGKLCSEMGDHFHIAFEKDMDKGRLI